MSQANLVLARNAVAAFNRRDVPALVELTTDDFQWVTWTGTVQSTVYDGAEGLAGYFQDADVWEVLDELRHVKGSEAKRIQDVATQLRIHERQVVIAVNYAAVNREEVDAHIRANDRALEEAERVARERDRLLA